jgi:hypothetical protein
LSGLETMQLPPLQQGQQTYAIKLLFEICLLVQQSNLGIVDDELACAFVFQCAISQLDLMCKILYHVIIRVSSLFVC